MSELKFGICGDLDRNNTPDEDNPLITLKKSKVKNMIEGLNRRPKSRQRLFSDNEEISEDIDKLLRLGVLKERDDKLFVNFTLIDEKDNDIVFDVCEKYAEDLAEEFVSRKDKIFGILESYENDRIEKEKLSFMIIGCYLLDWGSLELLKRWGICDHMKQKAGGNEYILWGESEIEDLLKGVYWGGHSLFMDDYTFHTFGDHHGYATRKAFPDLINIFPDFDFQGGEEFRSLLFEKRKKFLIESGELIDKIGKKGVSKNILKTGSEEKTKHIRLLKKINYIEEDEEMLYLKIPYFTEEDIDMIVGCMEPFTKILKRWTEENIEDIKNNLSEIRPVKNGVPFDEVFVQIWHVIFGLTNKQLAASNYIYDTYGSDSDHRGYLPALAKGDVLEKVEGRIKRSS